LPAPAGPITRQPNLLIVSMVFAGGKWYEFFEILSCNSALAVRLPLFNYS